MSEKEVVEGSKTAAPKEDSWKDVAGSVYREFENKTWTKEEVAAKVTEPAEFDKLVIASPYAKEISAAEFKKMDQLGPEGKRDGVLHMSELEDARKSGKFDASTTKAIEGLQKIIMDHPAKVGLVFGNDIYPMFPGVSLESINKASKAGTKESSWSLKRLFGS